MLIAAALVGLLSACGGSRSAPLNCAARDPISTSLAVHLRQPATYGFPVLRNCGTRPVILDGVTLVHPSAGLRYRGALVVRVADNPQHDTATDVRFPPTVVRRVARPIRGWEMLPTRAGAEGASDTELLIGLELDQPGSAGFSAIDVHYHSEGERFVLRLREAVTVCARLTVYRHGCKRE